MILTCNFEELRALASGADLLLSSPDRPSHSPVAAPAEAVAQVEKLQARLDAPIRIDTLAAQQAVRGAVAAICEELHDRLDEKVLEHHPAHEEAVSLYFDYAHSIAVLNRLDEMGAEMRGLIELMTGGAPTEQSAATITFPD